MPSPRTRAEALRAAADRLSASPILIDGDADGLLGIIRSGSEQSDITVTDRATLIASGQKAAIVILAVDGDGRRSSFARAATMLRGMDALLAPDAVQICVIQSGRSRMAPLRLRRLLASEILFQVTMAVPELVPLQLRRSIRQRIGLAALDAAGLRVIRFG
ncbi:hypothetical protein [Frigoribacterium sp. UYMn621]|uniref:hypothetical protein n=1 Tax=Frigoribacterium sp. UYMn621 TaxID=3156343 RepID=UPI00339B7801